MLQEAIIHESNELSSKGNFLAGTDSPVTMLSSNKHELENNIPSTGQVFRSRFEKYNKSPITKSSASTVCFTWFLITVTGCGAPIIE